MKVPNVLLSELQRERIQKLILDMRNKLACQESTGVDTRTIDSIMSKGWGDTEIISKLMNYCDAVEGLTTVNAAD